MKPMSLTRFTIGVMILAGMEWFRPLVYFTGIMMIFAGLTGICLLDLFYRTILGPPRSVSKDGSDSEGIGLGCG